MNLSAIDQHEFGTLTEPHRRELQAHCYRMVGSVHDAEDMVQETFLRAWRRRETYEGRASFRAWLYKIATNVCLDALDKRPRRVIPVTRQAQAAPDAPIPPAITEPIWLEPYPDDLLAADDLSPESYFAARENITLAFIAALHLLPPRQRAVLILRDVLDWQASEVADLLGLTIPAVKSALHRARTRLAAQGYAPGSNVIAPPTLDANAQSQLEDYVRAWENGDVNALMALLKEDAAFSMPPIPVWFRGRENVGALVARTIFAGDARGRWRLQPTRANGQLAFGLYRYDTERNLYQAYGVQVLTIDPASREVADITTFIDAALAPYFNLPLSLQP